MSLGDKFLHRLLERAESSWARSNAITASILFGEKSKSEYLSIETASDKKSFHGVLLHAQFSGAIEIEWDIGAGYQNQVKRVTLVDGSKLATLLTLRPLWVVLPTIEKSFSQYITEFPILEKVLEVWKDGRKPRGLGINDSEKILDAIKTITQCKQSAQKEITIRRMSARLGFDTKRLEAIVPALDLLTTVDIGALPREREELFAELGLVKHPSPVMVAGCLSLEMHSKEEVPIPFPYLGIPPNSITGIKVSDSCQCILSIENLTTFHELTQLRHPDVILIYSNGMPSPSWKQFYGMLIRNAPLDCKLYHWGDIDAGGYRISKNISEVAKQSGRKIKLHCMNPDALPVKFHLRKLDSKEVQEMQKIAISCDWQEESIGMSKSPYAFEQEILDLTLPN